MSRSHVLGILVFMMLGLLGWGPDVAGAESCPGIVTDFPELLQKHPDNNRWLTDGTVDATGRCKAVVLSGAHSWSINQHWDTEDDSDFDPGQYLKDLKTEGHNFTRGWTWEDDEYTPVAYGGNYNLNNINVAFLDRLEDQVEAAEDEGLYFSVMLFQGWSVGHKKNRFLPGSNPKVHPFATTHPYADGNNNQQIDGDSNANIADGMELHVLDEVQGALALQKGYVRAVIDRLNTFDNVIWEITNESHILSWSWQYDMIGEIRAYEDLKGYKPHLVWMSCSAFESEIFLDPGETTNDFMTDLANTADIVSPCKENDYDTTTNANPPEAGHDSKVVIADTDHIGAFDGNNNQFPTKDFVWRSFTRGLHPIFMDLTTDLSWWGGSQWNLNDTKWGEIREALGNIQVVIGDSFGITDMVPQARDSSFPSESGFGLFSTADTAAQTPDPDGLQFLLVETAGTTDLCGLLNGSLYRADGYDLTGVHEESQVFTASGTCKTLNIDGEVVLVEIQDTPPTARFSATPGPIISTGTVVSFNASASFDLDGGDLVLYEWDFNGALVQETDPFRNRGYNSAGSFTAGLRVEDDEGTDGLASEITITVQDPVNIIDNPLNVQAAPGGSASFVVFAEGTDLSYQWQKDGTPLVDGGSISGATTAVLVVSSVAPTDTGAYRCVVSNAVSQATSTAAALTNQSPATSARDTFSLDTGDDLSVRLAEVGGAWSGDEELIVNSNGELTVDASGQAVAGIAFEPNGLISRIEAEVDPTGSGLVALGFGKNTSQHIHNNGQVWIKISEGAPDDTYQVGIVGTANPFELLGSGTVPASSGSKHLVQLEYDPLATSVRAWINGVELQLSNTVFDFYPFDGDPFSPDIQHAVLHVQNGTEGLTLVDNVVVGVDPVVARDTFTWRAGERSLIERPLELGGDWQGRSLSLTDSIFWIRNQNEVTVVDFEEDPPQSKTAVAGVPFSAGVLPSKLSVDVDPKLSSYVIVGFSDSAIQHMHTGGQAWVKLIDGGTGTDTYNVGVTGNTVVASGDVPVTSNPKHHIEIVYDLLPNTLQVRINDEAIPLGLTTPTVEPFALDGVGVVPDIQFAVMHVQDGTNKDTVLDNFVVERIQRALRDTFTRPNNQPGSDRLLQGDAGEIGGFWATGDAELCVRTNGLLSDWVTAENDQSVAGLPYLPGGQISVLEVDVDPTDSTFVGFGFAKNGTGHINGSGQVWVRLFDEVDDTYIVSFVDALGVTQHPGSGTVPAAAGAMHHISIRHDPLLNTLQVSINDQLIELDGSVEPLSLGATELDIQYAVMHLHAAEWTVTNVDNFEVTQE